MDIGFSVAFLLLLFGWGLRKSGAVQTEAAYLVADRKTPLLSLVATLVMTEFNTATLLSFSSIGYLVGPFALWLPAVFFIGLTFYALTVARKWKAYDGLSVAGFFSKRYGRDLGMVASLSLLVAMLGFSAAYIKSLALLFGPFFPSSGTWITSSLIVSSILVMTLRGGLSAIIRTDLVSFWALLAFFPLAALFATLYGKGGGVAIEAPAALLSPRFIFSLILLTMFTYILAPWYGQKIFAAKSQKTAFIAVLLSAGIVFVLYALAVWAAWMLRKGGVVHCDPEQALPHLLAAILPGGLRGLGYILLFAATATTLSGVWSAMVALIVGDFFKAGGGEGSYRRSMKMTAGLATSSWLLANLVVDRVFDKLILANIPVVALSFALLAGFYWERSSRIGAYCSVIVGWAVGVWTYVYFGEEGGYTWYWTVWGLPAIFAFGIVGSFFFPDKKTCHVVLSKHSG